MHIVHIVLTMAWHTYANNFSSSKLKKKFKHQNGIIRESINSNNRKFNRTNHPRMNEFQCGSGCRSLRSRFTTIRKRVQRLSSRIWVRNRATIDKCYFLYTPSLRQRYNINNINDRDEREQTVPSSNKERIPDQKSTSNRAAQSSCSKEQTWSVFNDWQV